MSLLKYECKYGEYLVDGLMALQAQSGKILYFGPNKPKLAIRTVERDCIGVVHKDYSYYQVFVKPTVQPGDIPGQRITLLPFKVGDNAYIPLRRAQHSHWKNWWPCSSAEDFPCFELKLLDERNDDIVHWIYKLPELSDKEKAAGVFPEHKIDWTTPARRLKRYSEKNGHWCAW